MRYVKLIVRIRHLAGPILFDNVISQYSDVLDFRFENISRFQKEVLRLFPKCSDPRNSPGRNYVPWVKCHPRIMLDYLGNCN